MKQIIVLSDGETFTELAGCEIGTVLYDEHEQASLSQDEWCALVAKYESEGRAVRYVWDGARVIYETITKFS